RPRSSWTSGSCQGAECHRADPKTLRGGGKNDRRFHLFRRGDANHMPPWWPAGGIEFARQLAGGFSETAARGSGNVPLFQQSFLRHGSRSMMPFASNSVTTFGPDPLGDAPLRAELFGLERL